MGDGPVERPYLVKGQLLNRRYEIRDDINTGSFGHVILCNDTAKGDVKVAVKVQDRSEPRYHQGTAQKKGSMIVANWGSIFAFAATFKRIHSFALTCVVAVPHPQTSRLRLIFW